MATSTPSDFGTNNPQTVSGGTAGSVIIGPVSIKSDAMFENNVNILGTLTVADVQTDYSSITVQGDITGSGNLAITGNAVITGNLHTHEALTVDMDALVSGLTHLVGALTADAGISATTGNISAVAGNVSASGSVAAGTSITASTTIHATGAITGSNLSGNNTGDQTITLTGDVTGSGTSSFAATLASTAVSAGSYTSANITVDAKGRVTSAASGASNAITPTSISTSGNLTFTGTGNRILADWGNATATNRPTIQSNVSSSQTFLQLIPPTASTMSGVLLNASPTFAGTNTLQLIINGSTATLDAGTGTQLHLTQNGSNLIGFDTSGYVTVAPSAGRLGFFGVTPVVKAAAISAPTDLASCIVAINAIRVALTNLGITA